jgi:hypothetical protein
MPDILPIISRWWKMILGLTLLASLAALVACWLSPKQYASTVTALPGNPVLSDKARIFNKNIQYLYSRLGSPDELDRIEGTAALDTIYIATANDLNLVNHYSKKTSNDALYQAAEELKSKSRISRSAYGELKVKVWDRDRNMAAALANGIFSHLQQLHQQLHQQDNAYVLQKLREDLMARREQFRLASDSLRYIEAAYAELLTARRNALLQQVQEQEKLIAEYELALSTNPPVLVSVESARPSPRPEKPDTVQTVLLTAFASALFFFLLALVLESRKRKP